MRQSERKRDSLLRKYNNVIIVARMGQAQGFWAPGLRNSKCFVHCFVSERDTRTYYYIIVCALRGS